MLPGRLQILLVLLQEPQPIFKGEKTEEKKTREPFCPQNWLQLVLSRELLTVGEPQETGAEESSSLSTPLLTNAWSSGRHAMVLAAELAARNNRQMSKSC